MTPYEAIQAGADYIVVGRPIRLAADPVEAADKVVAEIARGIADRPTESSLKYIDVYPDKLPP
jgi:orotidine-5'-phosphate decarboxylase